MAGGGEPDCSSQTNTLLPIPIFLLLLLFSFPLPFLSSLLPPAFLTVMMLFSKQAVSRAKPKVGVKSSGLKWC